jgi:23S rRNA (uracil1939-C5)-methyltransferase
MTRAAGTAARLIEVRVESLAHEGRGVARVDGKAVFIDNALAGERVCARIVRRHRRYDEAVATEIMEPAPQRVAARCPHFSICGGCSLQHLDPAAQIGHKQAMLLDQLAHVGKVQPARLLPPLTGPLWGYRRRARLGVRHVPKKGGVLVGFREKASNFLAEITGCEVLDPGVGRLIQPLRGAIGDLSIADRIPQIEVAVGDRGAALTFRHLAPLLPADRQRLAEFGQSHDIAIYLQPGGNDTVAPLWPEVPAPLAYELPAHGVVIEFLPLDFIQVNGAINIAAIDRAIELLDLGASDHVLEFFCGLGNFSLPMARRVARVVGLEGDRGLVERARANAVRNGIANAEFIAADLSVAAVPAGGFNKVLLDPPRSGALELVRRLDLAGVERLLYVSCNPATLARDAGVLVRERGMTLAAAGIMDMFPHTAHVESIALFQT